MAKITRKFQKVFANDSTNKVAKFGSLKDGSPAFSKDPDDIQSLQAFLDGWNGAVVGNNSPALEDDNAIKFLTTYQLAYLMQQGIAEWNAATTYYIGSLCNSA